MAGLEVQIGADKSDFDKKIKEVEYDVKQLAKEKQAQIKLGLDTREITAKIKDAKKSLMDLRTTAKDAGTSFSKDFAPKVVTGGNALMQFSRIAQDAPFGIMGIGNNITATVEAFGHLKNSTGSTGSALKAMASSIMGSGGILLAVSLVTTGLTYMAQNGLTVGDVFNKLTGNFDVAKRSMQEMNVEAVKNSQAQISSVSAYVAAAKNINLSMNDRLLAVKKLQDEYPAYFGNLTKEEILNGNVATAVRGVTKALIAKAKATALTDRIVALSEEEEKIQNKVNASIAEMFRLYKLSKKEAFESAVILNKQLRGEIDLVGELNKGNANALSKTEKIALAAFQYSKTLQGLSVNLQNNRTQQDKLTDSLEKSIAASIKLESVKPKGVKTGAVGVTPQVSGLGATVTPTGLAETGGKVLQIAKNVQGAEGMITTSMGNINVAFDTSGAHMLEILQQLNADMNELITGSIADTFSQLGTSIGEALATGGNVFAAIGTSLLQSLGKFLSEMGGMLIQYGTLAVVKGKLDLAIAAGGPLSIGAGLAAIAVGVALKAVGGAISSKAKSGGSGGSVSTGASVSSPSSSTGSSSGGSSFQGGTVVFEISGQSLIGVLGNTLDKNRRLGGSLSLG